MGFWDFLQNVGRVPVSDPNVDYAFFEPRVEHLGGAEWEEHVREVVAGMKGMSVGQLWKSQPQLRTVVTFVARNVAHLGVHTFERISETDRRRSRDNRFARALANPGDKMTTYDLIFALVGDKLLYDRAYWMPWVDKDGKDRIRRLPPSWVSPLERDAFGITKYKVSFPGGSVDLPAERLIEFNGYAPTSATGCSPTIDVLKDTLAEQYQSTQYRAQTWKRGGRASSVIQRPANAPKWSDTAAERFRDDWYADYTGDGKRAGGTPILEDGMTLAKVDFSAGDQQWAEGVKLALATVATAFHINPTMVGLLDNANYSNVREFRKMLYGDSLGPLIAELEAVFNTFAIPFFKMDNEVFYSEFNIREKLEGSFEEQTAALTSAVGAPWMARSEARARMNLPAIDGADELVVPLNVLVGGQSSPRDSGTQNEEPGSASGPRELKSKYIIPVRPGSFRVKARATDPEQAKIEEVIRDFFKRQEAAVRPKLGVKADDDWWDDERWDSELSDDLYALAVMITKEVSARTLEAIGFSPDEYDADRTLAWLREVSDRSAASLNEGTKSRLQEALSSDSPEEDVDAVFASQDSHATMVAVSTATLLSGFATNESAKQVAGDKATKTWLTGKNARPEHAALDGETVLLSENFSNGAAWPGDGANLGAEDIANCNCELEISVP